ncbi:ATP-binding protein [Thalassotalea sp. PS06]|uniref:ATP-binding protein n=1 Tax=Thalassotalea sp. PS06 TaxID=2594005 RepID=UPI001165BC17|nr:ATP-binding protein [Thalassotalea sp. PS06]QDP00003.1 HAMP domain-containing protein [Thalassotalea sp. PS06]
MSLISRRWYSSLFVKMFLGFWLVALVSILVTRWVSLNLLTPPEAAPLNFQQQKILQRASKQIQQSLDQMPNSGFRKLEPWLKRNGRLPRELWLYDRDEDRLYTNARYPKPVVHDRLAQLNFPQPVKHSLPGYNLIGPKLLELQQGNLQLYIGIRKDPKNAKGFFNRLPDWLRLLSMFMVSALVCGILTWLLIKPVKRLTSASRQFGLGDLDVRVPEFERRHDELGELGQAFNRMAEQLNQHISAHKRLLGDVSHELRSPLTRLQLLISLIEKQSQDMPQLKENLDRSRNEIEQLDDMVGKALALSRLENQIKPIDRKPVDMVQLCQQICEEQQIQAQTKNIQLIFNPGNSQALAQYWGDRELLQSAISNVLNNAIKYSPSDSTVSLEIKASEPGLSIIISDAGQGVKEEDLQRIFKPFYREDNSRTRKTGGTGLGLAIAKDAVKRHGGTIKARATNPTAAQPGLSVIMELPYDIA